MWRNRLFGLNCSRKYSPIVSKILRLGHTHNDRESVLSYNLATGQSWLGVDDKMALSYLYPQDPSLVKESPTGGFGCSTE